MTRLTFPLYPLHPVVIQILAENIADSWMLLPVPLFLFTPSFITNLGCLYTGLVVPALNSIKVGIRVA